MKKIVIIALLLNLVAYGQTQQNSEISVYQQYDYAKIGAKYESFNTESIVVSNADGVQLKKGDVILFVTSDGNLGKLEIVAINQNESYKTTFNYTVYNNDGTVKIAQDNFELRSTWIFDFDKGSDEPISSDSDIWLEREGDNTTYFTPENELLIYLIP